MHLLNQSHVMEKQAKIHHYHDNTTLIEQLNIITQTKKIRMLCDYLKDDY